MIKLLRGREAEIEHLTKDYYNFHSKRVEGKIDAYKKRKLPRKCKEFLEELHHRLQTILIGKPDELASLITFFGSKYHETINKLNECLKDIFNYDRDFVRKYAIDQMGAYTIAKRLNISVCPYCNRQYIHTIDTADGRTRPQFDHFFDKATYPYLALSFYNLIPSCSICNSSLKGSTPFSLETHLHPYIDGYEDSVRFTLEFERELKDKVDYTRLWNGDTDVFRIKLEMDKSIPEDSGFFRQVTGNIDTFKINELYSHHKDYIAEIIVKSRSYNEEHIKALVAAFPDLFTGKEEVLRYLFGNYTSIDGLEKRVLAKLTRDISAEFKLSF